jgi:putative lipase involved disintegration of autophagic bodies
VALELYAHAGFLNATIKLLPQILDRVSKHLKANLTANIIFTGHSAGGAVATLLHLAVLSRFASAGLFPRYR